MGFPLWIRGVRVLQTVFGPSNTWEQYILVELNSAMATCVIRVCHVLDSNSAGRGKNYATHRAYRELWSRCTIRISMFLFTVGYLTVSGIGQTDAG